MHAHRKIVDLPTLLSIRQQARADGKTVVQCHGCFDIVHPGHIHHLQLAKSLGDVLIVSVSADTHVNKGINRPLVPDDLRAQTLAALECVDLVYITPDATAVDLLAKVRPDVYAKGKEYENNRDPRFLAEKQVVTQYGGRVICSSGDVIFSSTALIGQMEQQDVFQDEKLRRLRERAQLGNHELLGLINRFRGHRVAVVGDYILDRYHFCEAAGIAGESPMMSLRSLRSQDYDGGAAVIALHLAALGAKPILITSLSDDDPARHLLDRLEAADIEVRSVPRGRATVCKHRYLVEDKKMFKVDEGQAAPLDSQREALLADTLLDAAIGASAFVFADFGYGVITAGLLERIMQRLRLTVPVITADVSGQQTNLLRFRGVDLMCPTERELRETLHDFSSGLPATVWNLLQTTAAQKAIVTLGKQGLVTFERSPGETTGRLRSEYVPALAPYAVDPLGCGDALLATATLTLATGAPLIAAAFLGSVAAAIEVQRLGNHPITSDQLLNRLTHHDGLAEVRLAS